MSRDQVFLVSFFSSENFVAANSLNEFQIQLAHDLETFPTGSKIHQSHATDWKYVRRQDANYGVTNGVPKGIHSFLLSHLCKALDCFRLPISFRLLKRYIIVFYWVIKFIYSVNDENLMIMLITHIILMILFFWSIWQKVGGCCLIFGDFGVLYRNH